MNDTTKPAAALEPKYQTEEYAQYECHHCGSGLTIHKASAVPEQSRQQLHIMEHDDGRIAWYFDCDGHYIDVEKDDAGKYSIYFRDRTINAEAWLDQAEEAQAMHAANCATQLESSMRGPCDCDAAPERVQPSIDTPEFRKFFMNCGGGLIWIEEYFAEICAYIDAKLTQ